MDRVFNLISYSIISSPVTKPSKSDDAIDRLNHRYTSLMLAAVAIIITAKTYVGENINCWSPAEFPDNHEDYTNKICWVSNTYYLPIESRHFPDENSPKERISYYQWVPLILLCQALFFYIPCMIWQSLGNKAGLDVNKLISNAMDVQKHGYFEHRENYLEFIAKILQRYLKSRRSKKKTCLSKCKQYFSRQLGVMISRRYGNYLVVIYIMVKCLYLANALGQLFLLNAFLGTDYIVYGYEVIAKLLSQHEFTDSVRFPKVTICDYHIRQLGNIHRHTVQCVLPYNFFNEKIFIFFWFWFVFVALATFVSVLVWLVRVASRDKRLTYVRNHIRALEACKHSDPMTASGIPSRSDISIFMSHYLRQDGVFLIRLIGMNTNELIAAEVVYHLYQSYKTDKHHGGAFPVDV